MDRATLQDQENTVEDFAENMRARELYANTKLLPGAWIILRVDGRSFSKLTEEHFQKPFDDQFFELMCQTTQALVEELQASLAYTQSDEISIVLKPSYDLFDRRLEKLISLAAATASATFSLGFKAAAHFDARAWLGTNTQDVIDYIRWRSADATRCALNTCAYWTLVNAGESKKSASRTLESQSVSFKNELLFEQGLNFNDLPTWQRRGVIFHWQDYEKTGHNPITQQDVTVLRRRLHRDDDIPMKDALSDYLRRQLDAITNP